VQLVGEKHSTSTDENGFYFFLNLLPGSYTVRAATAGHAAATAQVKVSDPGAGQYTTADLTLPPVRLSGSVRRAPGSRPVAGVPVYAGEHATQTDSEGFFAFPELADGEHPVSVAAPGFVPQTRLVTFGPAEAVHQSVEFLLQPVSLSGTVVDRASRTGVSGARVEVQGHARMETDRRGHFSLTHLPPGRYRLTAAADGYGTSEQNIHVQDSQARVGVERSGSGTDGSGRTASRAALRSAAS